MTTPVVCSSDSAARTQAVAGALAAVLEPGDTVLLVGDLGAGKTTFTQGLAAGFGIAEAVTSPTFTLVRPYEVTRSPKGVRALLHADLYRLDRLQEVVELSLGDMVEDDAVAVVEWGDVAEDALGTDAVRVRIEPGAADDERTITIEFPAARAAGAAALRDALAGSAVAAG